MIHQPKRKGQEKRSKSSQVGAGGSRGQQHTQQVQGPTGEHKCPESLITNLSDKVLSPMEKQVLEKGLGFVPNACLDKFRLHCELAEFLRKLKLKAYFEGKEFSQFNTNATNTGLRLKSFTPPPHSIPAEITAFEQAVFHEVESFELSKVFKNMSSIEFQALQNLQINTAITIKPADKGWGRGHPEYHRL